VFPLMIGSASPDTFFSFLSLLGVPRFLSVGTLRKPFGLFFQKFSFFMSFLPVTAGSIQFAPAHHPWAFCFLQRFFLTRPALFPPTGDSPGYNEESLSVSSSFPNFLVSFWFHSPFWQTADDGASYDSRLGVVIIFSRGFFLVPPLPQAQKPRFFRYAAIFLRVTLSSTLFPSSFSSGPPPHLRLFPFFSGFGTLFSPHPSSPPSCGIFFFPPPFFLRVVYHHLKT